MNSRFKLGIFSWFGFLLPVGERLQLIRKAGFDAVTVWWEDEIGYEGGEREKVPDMIRDLGLELENMHVPFEGCNAFWSDSRVDRDDMLKKHLEWIRDCERHGIPTLVMHVTDGDVVPDPNPYGLAVLKQLVRAAEDSGVAIAIENTRRQDEFLPYIFSEIQSGHLGLCYDSSHDRLLGRELSWLLQRYGDRLLSTHLSDNDGIGDRHWLPGEGDLDWTRITEAFPGKYEGKLTLEVLPKEEDLRHTPEEFMKKAYTGAQRLEEMIGKNTRAHGIKEGKEIDD
jgi:sugar phosphate isomerase/epimerase